jgi:hypothetical protein
MPSFRYINSAEVALSASATAVTLETPRESPAALSLVDATSSSPTGRYVTSAWVDPAKAHIREFGWLDADWDSYGGSPISQRAIDQAANLIDIIDSFPAPDISPTSEGGIAFEWRTAEKYLTLEVTCLGFIEMIYEVGPDQRWAGSVHDSPLDQWCIIQKLFP